MLAGVSYEALPAGDQILDVCVNVNDPAKGSDPDAFADFAVKMTDVNKPLWWPQPQMPKCKYSLVHRNSISLCRSPSRGLTYSATLADNSPLPAWLSIDPLTGMLSVW